MTENYKLIYHGNAANLPSTRDANSFYLTDDTLELYFGSRKYNKAVRTYTTAEGKPAAAAEDVLYVNTDTGVGEVKVGGNWVVVIKGFATSIGANADDTTFPTSKAVKDYVDPLTAISAKADNILVRATADGEAGLYVPAPAAADTYEIAKAEDSGDFAAVYSLMRKPNGTGTAVKAGVDINIPKDMVVKAGSVVVVTEEQAGTKGFPAKAGTYIKLELQNVEEPLWIDVAGLIEYVKGGTAADGIITVAVDETTHIVTATIADGSVTKAKLVQAVQDELDKAHTHENKDLLDTYDQTNADIKDAVDKKHTHSNKAELDKIADGDKAKWDAAEQNAKDYADGLDEAMDARVDALEADTHTHSNKDELDKFVDGDKANLDAVVAALTVGTF